MLNLWNDDEAACFAGELGLRVYTSRLLGRDKTLVLHGGGNTSVKIVERNIVGRDETILYVKGSGWDLEHIEAAGFAPVRMDHLLELARLPALSDTQMVNELRIQLTRADAPTPSVEAILHAILPYKYVDHTHADAVITLTNTADGEGRIREVYGDSVVVIPYVMPGFDLARLCAERFPRAATPHSVGMVLMNHGIFSFGNTAKESYERMTELVTRAEDALKRHGAWEIPTAVRVSETRPLRQQLAELRHDISTTAGFPIVLAVHADPASLSFAQRDDVAVISQQGPATPDHVIRTKRTPMLGRDVKAYVAHLKYAGFVDSMGWGGATVAEKVETLIAKVFELLKTCNLPTSIHELGISRDDFERALPDIIRASYDDISTRSNPRMPLMNELHDILVEAYEGS